MEEGGTNVERLVPPMNLNSKDGSKREDVEEKEEGVVSSEKVEKVKEEDVGKEESGGGGGVMNNLISTLITPLSPSTGKATEHESGGQGGLISKMVSNFFHQSEGEAVVETEEDKDKEEEIMAGENIKRLKTENGGIIHNIASHLHASIPDDAVPTAEEATFLINSLVRD